MDQPGTASIVSSKQELIVMDRWDGTSNALCARVPHDYPHGIVRCIDHRLDLTRFIEGHEIAERGTCLKIRSWRNASGWNSNEEHSMCRLSDANDSPLNTYLILVASPQDLSRAVGLRLECRSTRVGDIGILMPSLLNIHTGCDDACKNYTPNFVFCDWFDGYTESSHMLVGVWTHRLDRCITYETSKCRGPKVRIAQWGVETDNSTDGHSGLTLVVNANGGSVANVGAVSSATRETITSDGIGGRQHTVVFRCRDVEFLAGSNSPRHYSIPNALKFASG
jgi:hypothetical protein